MTNRILLTGFALMLAFPATAAPLVPPSDPRPAPRGAMREGMDSAARGDLDAARERFEALNRASPAATGPYLGLAEVAARGNDVAAAEAHLKAGIAAIPRGTELYRALGRLLVLQNRPDEAVAAFDAATSIEPGNSRSRLEIAELLTQRLGQHARALTYYEAVLALDASNAAAHYGRGLTLARTGKPELALSALREAVRLQPDNPLAEFTSAQVLIGLNRSEDALAVLDASLARQPGFLQARIAKGSLLQSLNRSGPAAREFEAALAQEPGSLGALMGLGMARQSAGLIPQAEAAYRAALVADPGQIVAMNNLAWLAADGARNLDEALAWARQAVAGAPNQAAFLDTLGWVHRQRGELAEAEANLVRAVGIAPSAEVLTRLGLVRAGLGRKTEAAAAFRRALQLTPGYALAQRELNRVQ